MTKNIALSDTAYIMLKQLKATKSFSEIIIELVNERRYENLKKFAGLLTDKEAKEMKKQIYEDRKLPSRRFS